MNDSLARRLAERFSRLTAAQRSATYQKVRAEGLGMGQFPILPRDSQLSQRCPLSYAQARQWFLWQLEPDSTAYHIAAALRLKGALSREAMRLSFEALVQRHESLRTVFRPDEFGVPQQVVLTSSSLDLVEVESDEAGLREAVRSVCDAPFDLAQGPLLRPALLRLAADEHVLMVVLHHIVADDWSLQLIVREFAQEYGARVQGQQLNSVVAAIQYADYAVWQRQWLEAGERERQLEYWKGALGDEQPLLQLSTDRARRADGRYREARCVERLPAALADAVLRRAQAEGATPFMLLLAAFQVLLYRYSGQSDVRVGVPIANRHRVESETVIGFFVNTQVLRSALRAGTTLREALAATKEAALGAQQHQDLPFEQLVEALHPERSFGVNPLFQVMFNHLRDDGAVFDALPGLSVEGYELEGQEAQFELSLDTSECSDGTLRVCFSYAEELFEPASIQRLCAHYRAVLEAFVATPELGASQLELLSEPERRDLFRLGRNAQRAASRPLIAQQFEEQARQRPEAVAVLFESEQVSYAELNERANRLAHRLIAAGVKAESRVGIAVQRSIPMVVAVLAVLKSGGAYVPLDPTYPAERLSYMLEDSGIDLLLKDDSVAVEAKCTLSLDALDLSGESKQNPVVELHEQNLAYVIYTSGSTGKPKGIGITQGTFAEHIQVALGMFGLTATDRLLQFATINFDASVEQLFCPLVVGAAMVLRGPEVWDCEKFYAELIEKRITVSDLPASYWQMLSQEFARAPRADYGAWRQAQAMGEAMPPEALKSWREAGLGHLKLLNSYGPTETVITATLHDCTPYVTGEAPVPTVMPIGGPLGGRNLYVLDADLSLTPRGVAGELYIGGELLARGYNERGALTAERFVADPFDGGGGRLYRTGDLVRWTRDGVLEYLGRVDHQVKIRGFRIELGEVEAQLLANAGVREAVVVAKPSAAGARLVAYVAGDQVEPSRLREALSQTLPEYMVPSAIVVLSALPQTPNGKLDRRALPEPELESERGYEEPIGVAERVLAEVWSELLGVERVGRRDNFFELGGHSLLAIQVLARLRQRGLQADVRSLFQQPELSGFAATLKLEGAGASEVPPVLIPEGCERLTPEMLPLARLEAAHLARIESEVPGGAGNIQDIYPLAPLQEGILFHHLLQSAGDVYVTPCLLSFTSEAGLERFVAALNRAVARHDILRTAVLWEGLPEPVQVVYRRAGVEIEWLDAAQWSGGDVAEALSELVHPSRYRMDVRRAPMIRALAVKDAQHERFLLQLPSHHLVLDHTTLDMLVEELSWIEQGREAELPATQPFRNLLAHIQAGPSRAEHEAFFRGILGDVEEPTAPFNVLDVYGDGTQVGEARLRLDAELSQRVRSEAQRRRVSAASLFHLAWALVLARTTGKDDVVFGTVLLGRLQGASGTERAFGMFMNTLPLRVKLQDSVEHGLKATHDGLAQLLEHEYASLSLAQRCSGLPGGTPLFSAMLNYRHNAPSDVAAAPAWPGMQVLASHEYSNYPFAFSVDDFGSEFRLFAQMAPPIDPERVCQLVREAVEAIVSALAQSPQRSLRDLTLLTPAERVQLQHWGVNEPKYAACVPVQRLFEGQVERAPNATALIFGQQELSYAELNRRANRLAHRLIALGVKPEVKVGLGVERSIDMVVALIAILKAGGAYVPLDPEYPAERLRYMASDSGIELLLTQSWLRRRFEFAGVPALLELDSVDVNAESERNPEPQLHGENLAYVIYTSGSTGKPKGVAVTHGPLSMHVQAIGLAYEMRPDDRELQFASINFDGAHERTWVPLAFGAALMPRDNEMWSVERTCNEIAKHGITMACFTPSYLHQLAEGMGEAARSLPIRSYTVGGEAMPRSSLELVQSVLRPPRIINGYGPTETVITPTIAKAFLDDRPSSAYMPIGRLIGDRTAYVLDADLNLLPRGVAGELYLGGAGVARGYLQRPDLSAERFVPDPFADGGGRMYRSGDLARWNEHGELEYLGRVDHQVKIRGFRIELGEIEAQLLAQPELHEAVVVAKQGPAGARLVAYVAPRFPTSNGAEVLRARLAQALPEYMLPAQFVEVDRLPLNPNGKVDRKALPDFELGSVADYEAPRGDVEIALATIWADVLQVEQVSRSDNFFELGGDSILALQVVARASKSGVSLELKQLFSAATLAELAASVSGSVLAPAIVPLDSAARSKPLRCSFAQARQWFLWQLDPESTAYHLSGALELSGELDAAALQGALQALVARHEALRTVFRASPDGEPELEIRSDAALDWRFAQLSQNELEAAVREVQQRPFDLGGGPLLRAALFRVAPERHVLTVVMHHIVSDGWSMQVVVRELVAEYRARVLNEPLKLAPLAVQYADYAAWQREFSAAGEGERQLEYWKQQLGGEQPVLQLATDFARRSDGRYQSAQQRLELSVDSVRGLSSRARATGATLFMLLLSGFQGLLQRYTSQGDIRVGVPIANRHRAEIAGVVGFFVNTQVLRGVLSGRTRLSEMLAQTKQAALGAQAHQDLPFEQLVEALQPERSLGVNPLFQVMFNHQREEAGERVELPGLRVGGYELAEQAAQFELSLDTHERLDGSLSLSISYAKELFLPATIARLGDDYVTLLNAMVASPESALGDVELLSDSEYAGLDAWGVNREQREFEFVHRAIEQRVKAHPARVALLFGEQQLSYGELNRRANQLAHRLIGLGVKPDVTVGIAVERSVEMVVGLLGIMKAGGAYVPLDPEYPRDRLSYMVETSGTQIVLTQASVRERLPELSDRTLLVLDALDLSGELESDPTPTLSAENLSYVIFTSGSTGRPKGAANRHAGFANRLQWMRASYDLGASDTLLQKTPFSFDVSVWEFFWPLMVGARLAVAKPGDHRDPARLVELIRDHQVTVMHFVPSMLQAFLAHEGIESCTGLRRIVCSGEALPAEAQARVFERLPQVALNNLYGPTEASIEVTHWACRRDAATQVPIGRAISGIKTYVLDADLNRVPAGVSGELFLGGVCLARGYVQRPSLTAERFVADPHDPQGGRLYRTGDRVRFRADGELEYLGRFDHQLKIRGFRIELGEIEAQLLSQPELREAVVVAKDGPGGARLVAYVSLHAGQGIEVSELRARLGAALPDYMVPSSVIVLDTLPLSANGKVDRKALPDVELVTAARYEAPEGETEQALAQIWSEVLRVERVGRNDNFFDLGGHSLAILRVQARLEERLGVRLPLRSFFEQPQLFALGAAVEQARRGNVDEAADLANMDALLKSLES
ncbi:MAG: amino acid adenylation domain-containing protein [Polyangiaceae bacterium]